MGDCCQPPNAKHQMDWHDVILLCRGASKALPKMHAPPNLVESKCTVLYTVASASNIHPFAVSHPRDGCRCADFG